MEVDFRHANPTTSNESTLIRFDDGPGHTHTPCLLIDAGRNVDVESLLREDDYLAGIIITHAHIDHYTSLADNLIDNAPVYMATDTAKIFETVLNANETFSSHDTTTILDAITPVDDWVNITTDIRIHPVPAGHAPGAAGFLVQFRDDNVWRTILATGDFSLQRVAGYPRFTTNLPVDIEALILTGATAPADADTDMTPALSQAVEYAQAGARVLLTTTGLTGVTAAYRLGHLGDELGTQYPIGIFGQAAKLYKQLEYDIPQVHAITEFDDASAYFREGMIAISSPQVPRTGAAAELFAAIKHDSNAALIQLTNGASTPRTTAACTITDFTHAAHPTEADVDALVETLAPLEVFITHQTGSGVERYRDKYSSYVWATDDPDWYQLYNDEWQAPPWMTAHGKAQVYTNRDTLQIPTDSDETAIPTPTRDGTVDLAAEGLTLDAFHTEPATITGPTPTPPPETETDGTSSSDAPESTSTPTSDQPDATAASATGTTVVRDAADTVSTTARVIDGGDGLTLLRVTDSDAAAALRNHADHGDELTLTVTVDDDT